MTDLVDRIKRMARRRDKSNYPGEGEPGMREGIDHELFMAIANDDDIMGPLRALYVAESAKGDDDNLSNNAYLAAALEFKQYEMMLNYAIKEKGKPGEIDQADLTEYLGLVQQIKQHCIDKCGYFPKPVEGKPEG